MKLKLITLLALSLGSVATNAQAPATAPAKEPAQAEKKAQAEERTDFLRVSETEASTLLQTGVTRYEKDGVIVDLLGAVHIADKAYYDQLNKAFTQYDSLLFEMVGGEAMQQEEKKQMEAKKKKDAQMGFLGKMYQIMADRLDLVGQKDGIDYSKDNFVHADLTLKEFNDMQKAKGESLLQLALKNAQNQAKAKAKGPDTMALLKALMKNDSDALKLAIVHTLGAGDDQVMALAGKDSVIIGDRNVKCLEVMDAEIAKGKKKLGIFYGAAHFPDMEERMLKQGFKKTKHIWLNAWDIKNKVKK